MPLKTRRKYTAVGLLCLMGCLLGSSNAYAMYKDDPQTASFVSPNITSLVKKDLTFQPHTVIIKFKDTLIEPADQILSEQRLFSSVLASKDDSLDQLTRKYKIFSMEPIRKDISKTYARKGKNVQQLNLEEKDHVTSIRERFKERSERAPKGTETPSMQQAYLVHLDPNVDEEAVVKEFGQNPDVEYVSLNYVVTAQMVPNDPYYSSHGSWGQQYGWGDYDDLWGVKKVQPEKAWNISQGEGEIVAVVDTGVDYNHPDIKNNVWTNPSPSRDDLRGWNFVDNTNDPMDDHGHGTHVAGVIAAEGNNNIGIIGIAPKAKIMPLKALNFAGSGTSDKLAEAIRYAADHGATVISNSWGCRSACPSNPLIEEAVRYAYSLGAVVVFAAGNSNADIKYTSPQNMGLSIVVSAFDQNDKKCGFSSYGSLVDVAAPGCEQNVPSTVDHPIYNILSLLSSRHNFDSRWVVGGEYARLAGTSMATPFVSGAAAVMLSKNPTWIIEQVRKALHQGADDVDQKGVDVNSGYGRLNVTNSLANENVPAVVISKPILTELKDASSVDVYGIAYGKGLKEWKLEYGEGASPATWTTIASSNQSVPEEARLGSWDLRNLNEGSYVLRLSVTVNRRSGVVTYTDQKTYSTSKFNITRVSNLSSQCLISAPINLPISDCSDLTHYYAGFGNVLAISGSISLPNFQSYSVEIINNSTGKPLKDPQIKLMKREAERDRDGVLVKWDTSNVVVRDILYNNSFTVNFTVYYNGRFVKKSFGPIQLFPVLTLQNQGKGQGSISVSSNRFAPTECSFSPGGTCSAWVTEDSAGVSVATLTMTTVPGSIFNGWDNSALGCHHTASSCSISPVGRNLKINTTFLPSPYLQWLNKSFTPQQLADPWVSGSQADPDQDSIINWLEYVYNLNPFQADVEPPVRQYMVNNHLVIQYRMNKSAKDVSISIGANNSFGSHDQLSPTGFQDIDANTQLITAMDPKDSRTDLNRVLFLFITKSDPYESASVYFDRS